MRTSLLCSLILIFTCNVFAEEQQASTNLSVTPLVVTPSQQEPAPAGKQPDWLPLPETSPAAPSPSTAAPLLTQPQAEEKPQAEAPPPPAQPAQQPAAEPKKAATAPAITEPPATAPATTEPPAKKPAKPNQRGKVSAIAKSVGPGNNVPLLLAGSVDDTELLKQQISPWTTLFGAYKPLLQVTAAPPLLAGARPLQSMTATEEPEPQITIESVMAQKVARQEEGEKASDSLDILASLVELQKNIKQQIAVISKKLKASTSDAEKQSLQDELTKLDKQLSETGADFERIATGVEPAVFAEQQPVTFSWKDEVATLLEPTIKELKQLTARARLKSELKETIADHGKQRAAAQQAVAHLNRLMDDAKDPKIKAYLGELLPAWQNVEKRISSKLDLAQRELAKLEDKDVSLLQSSSNSVREFFRDRGLYLLIAFAAFVVILLAFRLAARLLFFVLPGAKKEQRPIHVRILDIFFQVFSVFFAICGLIFVLYTAEDWFLLSATIVLFFGLAWTVRQTLPKMWQQVRLVLNMGSIREGERVIYEGVPWRVESLNVFCKLYNPAMAMYLRIPIENMLGLVSRPYHNDEPWFPCKRGDWIAIDGKPFAKVVSLSHEQVEVVELGGRRTVYQTGDFLGMSPANLSRNFSLRVVFGLSYDLQAEITTTVLETMKNFLQQKLEENGYAEDCLSLTVDFLQAGASSLDVAVLADFKGEQAPAYRRIERALGKWCVDCCNANNWEIPFPQMTVHLPSGVKA
jgi:small-conductance mechanosensitive channel